MSEQSNIDFKKRNDSTLDAPISLPDSLIDKFGLIEDASIVANSDSVSSNSQKLPEDLVDKKELLDKIDDSSSKVEFFKDEPTQEKMSQDEDIKKENSTSSKTTSNSNISENKPSFFGELQSSLSNREHEVDKHFSNSIVDMMKKFHIARSRGEHFFFHEQELEDVLYKKMLKLKEIEDEWLIRAREYNIAKELLSEKEDEIEKVSSELKSLLKKSNRFKLFNRKVSHDKAFRLKDGKLLLSLSDLVKELRVVRSDVFNYHVSLSKHDFADWVLHVFEEENLANLIKSCKDKSSLIELLDNY